MDNPMPFLFLFFLLNPPIILCSIRHSSRKERPVFPGINIPDASGLQNYIVQVRKPNDLVLENPEDFKQWHVSLLASITPSAVDRLFHSYSTAMNAFAAKLAKPELDAISRASWFVHAYPDSIYTIQTTRSPEFLGLHWNQTFWSPSNGGKGIIIGVIDTGVHPFHPSFNATDIPPPPSKWKGVCEFGPNICNNKLIGGRSFINSSTDRQMELPFDRLGHGTHVASIAAGRPVEGANVWGNARGTATGIAPLAHVAVYKVCNIDMCLATNVLKGIDAAIEDEVDILSISVTHPWPQPFFLDPVAIGSFRAIERGIFSSAAAGNAGPQPYTVTNDAPWVLTVAASTIDRSIRATVKLGNEMELDGEAINKFYNYASPSLPLVYPGINGDLNTSLCISQTLGDVEGKVVLCDHNSRVGMTANASYVKRAGAAGMILASIRVQGDTTFANLYPLPTSHVSYEDGLKIKAYIQSTKNPTARIIFKGTITDGIRAPQVGFFSSRGPSKTTPGILKPDITGPGVNIIAGGIKIVGNPPRGIAPGFLVDSGTSMSCPHLSGIVALLKNEHPDWTPAMIKSAIMTTADVLDSTGNPILDERHEPADYFAMGAGHVNITKANDPGFVYDIKPRHYIRILCALGYNSSMIVRLADHRVDCRKLRIINDDQLNYPSITIAFTRRTRRVRVTRTATNVSGTRSTYAVQVKLPEGVSVSVKPSLLKFKKAKQRKKFVMTFVYEGEVKDGNYMAQGELKWVSGEHVVRSPISILFNKPSPLLKPSPIISPRG